jgi:hypothetical protein
MPCYAVYRNMDGSLSSVGTILAEPLLPEFTAKALKEMPDLSNVIWDSSLRDFIPRPPEPSDPVHDAVLGFADLDVSALTQAQLIALMVKALKFLVKRELNRG